MAQSKDGVGKNCPTCFLAASISTCIPPVDGPFHIPVPSPWNDPFGAMATTYILRLAAVTVRIEVMSYVRAEARDGHVGWYMREMSDHLQGAISKGL